jgi:hypothetical protein
MRRWRLKPTEKAVMCDRCGSFDVKWKLTDDGWRLFETDERREHNRSKLHECTPPDVDDFDVVDDAPPSTQE